MCICEPLSRHVSDFDLRKLMYNGAISMVYHAVDKRSGITVALKLYKRIKLNEIERHQVRERRRGQGMKAQHVSCGRAAFRLLCVHASQAATSNTEWSGTR